ncbi:cytokine receptor common subunit beta-like isoform X2 [Cheilinus undulatus]|uniref:cytokine receptor common subunit beta-like isoform X2 n=1 Tax=Cheilinus undulatus TaxID=241271 RepID=UPI001BD20845|nr:cytokine receptor common subunit beta-like isoform X2 [Cheilinus undulatus]
MERIKKTILLILPLLLIHACSSEQQESCPSQPDKYLSCYNNYSRTITCEWNSMNKSDQMCTIYARKGPDSSCDLKPVDISKPGPRKCTMMFKKDGAFQSFSVVPIDLICNPGREISVYSISYRPSCHIKLDPPQRPKINSTTVSWFPPGNKRRSRISLHKFQLQWKHKDQSWEDAFQQKSPNLIKNCEWECETKLQADWLIRDEEYEVRVRVMGIGEDLHSAWSDWSAAESLVSPVGRTKPDHSAVIFGTAVCSVVITAVLAVIYLKQNKTIWIYMVMKFRSQPIPNPAKSKVLKDANFQNHLCPTFPPFNPLEITSVEITSPVDAVTPYRPEAALLEKIRVQNCYDSTSSGFSNPSYAHLCPSPPSFPLPTVGNLTPCAADTPYGPVCGDTEVKEAEERKEVKVNEAEVLELLSKGSKESKPGLEISDYEKVEKLQVERSRLQSLDSGVCSGEEVSQESLEADSINVTESIDEEKEEEEESKGEGVFQRLFGNGGNVVVKGSIQVCSEYERVPTLPSDTTEELVSSSEKEEQFSHEESLEDEDKSTVPTSILAPPDSTSLNFTGPAFSPALQPQQCSLLEKLALMSTSRSVVLSGDGYMPVRLEQS